MSLIKLVFGGKSIFTSLQFPALTRYVRYLSVTSEERHELISMKHETGNRGFDGANPTTTLNYYIAFH